MMGETNVLNRWAENREASASGEMQEPRNNSLQSSKEVIAS